MYLAIKTWSLNKPVPESAALVGFSLGWMVKITNRTLGEPIWEAPSAGAGLRTPRALKSTSDEVADGYLITMFFKNHRLGWEDGLVGKMFAV